MNWFGFLGGRAGGADAGQSRRFGAEFEYPPWTNSNAWREQIKRAPVHLLLGSDALSVVRDKLSAAEAGNRRVGISFEIDRFI
jgi:hypothetical protein